MKLFTYTLILLSSQYLLANTKNSPHLPISHCYHWLDEASSNYLTFKYNFAKNNKNELTFFTTPASSNGSVAGPGLYCAKSPSGSYSYGDRIIRIDFVDDIVLYDNYTNIQYCGLYGETSKTSPECQKKSWDIKFYSGGGIGNTAWYVIQNPEAIKAWSSNSDQVIYDLEASVALNGFAYSQHAQSTIKAIRNERNTLGEKIFHTQSKRSSIADIILNDPAKLRKIPALNIIQRLSVDQNKQLTTEIREDLYLSSLMRTLKNEEIHYSDYKAVFKNDSLFKIVFSRVLEKLSKEYSKYNSFVFLEAYHDPDFSVNYLGLLENMTKEVFNKASILKDMAKSSMLSNDTLLPFILKNLSESVSLSDIVKNSSVYLSIYKKVYSEEGYNKLLEDIKSYLQKLNTDAEYKLLVNKVEYGLYDVNSDKNKSLCTAVFTTHQEINEISIKYLDKNFEQNQYKDSSLKDICDNLLAITKQLSSFNHDRIDSATYTVSGHFDDRVFIFLVNNIEEVSFQCKKFFNNEVQSSPIKKFSWSMPDGNTGKNYFSTFNDPHHICKHFSDTMARKIPQRQVLEAEKYYENLKKKLSQNHSEIYKVTGYINNTKYFFFGETTEKIIEQCLEFNPLTNVNNYNYSKALSVSIDDNTPIIIDRGYFNNLNSIEKLCGAVFKIIVKKIPFKWVLNAQVKFDQEKLKSSEDLYKVSGYFEKTPFLFYGKSLNQIKKQCINLPDYLLYTDYVDHISWSINDSPESIEKGFVLRATDSHSLCNKLLNLISSKIPSEEIIQAEKEYHKLLNSSIDQPSKDHKIFKVTGQFEGTSYFFFGETTEVIKKQCYDFYQNIRSKDAIKTITWKVDNSPSQNIQFSFNIPNQSRLCDAFILNISDIIPSEFHKDAKQAYEEYKTQWKEDGKDIKHLFKVSGSFEKIPYIFYGEDLSDIKDQCFDFFSSYLSEVGHIYKFSWSTNGQEEQIHHSSWYSLHSKNRLCTAFHDKIKKDIPGEDEKEVFRKYHSTIQKNIEAYNSSDDMYKVSGTFGQKYKYYFFGNYQEDITRQCRSFFRLNNFPNKKVSRIETKVNGSSIPHYSYYNDHFCNVLIAAIKKTIPSLNELSNIKDRENYYLNFLESKKTQAYNKSFFHTITGTFGDYDIFIAGNYLDEIKHSCENLIDIHPQNGNFQRLTFALNMSELFYNGVTSYDSFCEDLEKSFGDEAFYTKKDYEKSQRLAKLESTFNESDTKYNFKISINSETLFLSVNSIDEVENECLNQSEYIENLRPSNQVSFISDEDKIQKSIELEYIENAEFCQKLPRVMIEHISTSFSQKLLTAMNNSTDLYKVQGSLGATHFYFHGNSADEIYDQCRQYYDELEEINEEYGYEIGRFLWSTNLSTKRYYIGDKRTLRSDRSTCRLFKKNLKKQLR